MNLFEGLLFYEIILLALGILLFLVILFILVYFVLKNRSMKRLIPFFLISIIMVGFPGIQKIRFDNGVIEIEKLAKEVEQNPSNPEIKKELENRLTKIEERDVSSPKTLRTLEHAYSVLGDEKKVRILRDKRLIIKRTR